MMDLGGHLRGLFRFAGRERRTTFWLWVLISYLAQMVVSLVAGVTFFVTVFDRLPVDGSLRPGPVAPPAFAFIGWIVLVAAVALFAVLMIAAAVTRRLHDTGRSGWWGALPVFFQFVGFAVVGRLFVSGFPSADADWAGPPPEFLLLLVNNLLGFVALVALIVFCCLDTQEYTNRYGPPPGPRVG